MIDLMLAARIPARINRLEELAYNIWWSWHPEARDVFRALNYPAWKSSGHNPVEELCATTQEQFEEAAVDSSFLSRYDAVMADFDAEMKTSGNWFTSHYPEHKAATIAYFCMEFALHTSLPIYAGGLGILAGDMCKEASDLGLPLVGIGFMYPQGYFHQHIGPDGWQQEIYPQLDFREAPINPVLLPGDQRCITRVMMDNRTVAIGVWVVRVGRVNVYLLDTNLEENAPEDRELSARLYTADPEIRIKQEIILGIGGVNVLSVLGIQPAVWHANEGHSAFMCLERIRREIERGLSFEEALERVRATSLFTTHTPVPSGHDAFSDYLMDKYFSHYWPSLHIDRTRFLELGHPDIRGQNGFNMTALAINTTSRHNAVSRLHEYETRRMWPTIWYEKASDENRPARYVTNGVHLPTWIGFEFIPFLEKYLGPGWFKHQDDPGLWKLIEDIPDEEIWAIRNSLKSRMIEVIVERAQARWADGELQADQVPALGVLFSPQVLTIGFARRFTGYKRPALILYDLDRLRKIVNDPAHPVQVVFAGKPHPNDLGGKSLLNTVYSASRDRLFQGRVGFVEDYNMLMARYLTHGIDVWLNTPYRLQEASGTSGMKAAINGILNLSVRDGWWEEGYNGHNGWAVGDGPEGADDPEQDKKDAESLYKTLEEKIVPLYYLHDRRGIPHGWIKMIKESMYTLVPRFCATRMVKEYIQNLYTFLYP
jgi:glycogen phosphorylase